MARGEAYPHLRYCAASLPTLTALGLPESTITSAGGGQDAWISPEHWDTLTRNGFELMTAPEFLIAQLENAIRLNAAVFLTIEEAEALLSRWQEADGEAAKSLTTILENPRDRLRFARLLRALACEQVSVAAWTQIVEVVRQVGLDDRDRALREVRRQVQSALAPQTSVRSVTGPQHWEEWLRGEDGAQHFEVGPREAYDALALVRTWMQADDPPGALVARTPELRPLLKRLVEAEFPELFVLAQSELPKGHAIAAVHGSVAAKDGGDTTDV